MTASRTARWIVAVATAALAVPAVAQDYPTRPITLVVPYTAGGGNDAMARVVADRMSAALGQQIVIENRGGAGGSIATRQVARAEPDGYTLLVSGIPVLVLGPAMSDHPGFDPIHDFTHVGYFGGTPNILVVHPTLNVSTYAELLALARSLDGLEYVSAGFGTMGNWVAEYLAMQENIKLTHVPHRATPQAMLDLLAGRVKVGMFTWSTVAEHIRAGSLIPLAASSSARLAYLPDVPTLKELGHSDFVAIAWYSLSAPAGIPASIASRLNREIIAAMDTPQVRGHIEKDAVESRAMTPVELTAFIAGEMDRWQPLIRRVLTGK
jgi:tripartite-type tricarboxylate transporter receptor subunit TctC